VLSGGNVTLRCDNTLARTGSGGGMDAMSQPTAAEAFRAFSPSYVGGLAPALHFWANVLTAV
jgi:hypothetical protein